MKKSLLVAILFLFISAGAGKAQSGYETVSFNYFYQSLAPYGEWIDLDGVYAWRPVNIQYTWQPYTIGRWEWSSYGWYWDSNEPFGWATYHYGRWYDDEYYGWIWIPDDQWGPSWVEWRYTDDYIGWAPLPPYAVFRQGVGIYFTIEWHFPVSCWNYVSYNHFHGYNVNKYFVQDRIRYRIHSAAKYRNSYELREGRIINHGVDRTIVERHSGRPVAERNLLVTSRLRDNTGDRNNNGRIVVFRPDRQEINKVRDLNNYSIQRGNKSSSLRISELEAAPVRRDGRIDVVREPGLIRKGNHTENEKGMNNNEVRKTPVSSEVKIPEKTRNLELNRQQGTSGEDRKVEDKKRIEVNPVSNREMKRPEVPQQLKEIQSNINKPSERIRPNREPQVENRNFRPDREAPVYNRNVQQEQKELKQNENIRRTERPVREIQPQVQSRPEPVRVRQNENRQEERPAEIREKKREEVKPVSKQQEARPADDSRRRR